MSSARHIHLAALPEQPYCQSMIFGGGKDRGDPAGDRLPGHVPVDFMHEPHWTKLANDVSHDHLRGGEIAQLSVAERDYAYRVVANLDSSVTTEQAMHWYRDAPNGVTAGLAGAAKVREARRIRKGRRLFDMTPDESDRYRAILADAETFLLNATAKHPDAVLPWIPRIDLARGLKLGTTEIIRRFAEAQAREPWNFLACESAFEGQTPRWSGSYEQLFDFAADAVAAPAGHPARALAAYAEAERMVKDRNMDLGVMPTRASFDFHAQFGAFMRHLPDELGPHDVVALGAWIFIITPKDAKEAEYMIQALELLRRRCGGYPYTILNDPLAWFQRIVNQREEEARALG